MSYRVSDYFPIGLRGEPQQLRVVYLRWGVGSRLPDWDIDPIARETCGNRREEEEARRTQERVERGAIGAGGAGLKQEVGRRGEGVEVLRDERERKEQNVS